MRIIAKYRFSDQFGRESIRRQAFVGEDSETVLRSIVAMIGIGNLISCKVGGLIVYPRAIAERLDLPLPFELMSRLV